MKLKTQKGITLIALIITIIVMLILVGVTVTVVLNGGLFNTAKQATSQTEIELEKERLLELALGALDNKGQVDFENKLDPAIAKDGTFQGTNGTYTSKKTGNKYTVSSRGSVALDDTIPGAWEQNGDEIKFVAEDGTILKTLTVGEPITYDEGTSGSYTTDANKGTGTSYTSSTNTLNQGTYKVAPTDEEKQAGVAEAGDLSWAVLGVNDAGQVEIISTTQTTGKLTLYGKAGYLNAVTENDKLGTLDAFCNELYGKGTGAINARSITPKDLYELMELDYEPEEFRYSYKWLETADATGIFTFNSYNNSWEYTCRDALDAEGISLNSSNPGPIDITLNRVWDPVCGYSNDWSSGRLNLIISFFPHYEDCYEGMEFDWGVWLDCPCWFAYRWTQDGWYNGSVGDFALIQGVGFTDFTTSSGAWMGKLLGIQGEEAWSYKVCPIVTLDTNYLINL